MAAVDFTEVRLEPEEEVGGEGRRHGERESTVYSRQFTVSEKANTKGNAEAQSAQRFEDEVEKTQDPGKKSNLGQPRKNSWWPVVRFQFQEKRDQGHSRE